MENQADRWRNFRNEFEQLAREEQRREIAVTTGKALRAMDQLLRASCSYREHPEGCERGKPGQGLVCLLDTPPHGAWDYDDGISDNFRERVRVCVANAGRALADCPKDAKPEDFWLHRLYRDLLENNSDLLFAASEEGGMIVSVCVASATFCSRLERQELEQFEPDNSTGATGNQVESPGAQNSANSAQNVVSKSADVAVGRHWFDSDTDTLRRRQIVLKNPKMKSPSLCKVFDAATPPIPLPRDWKAELSVTTWSEAYKNQIGRQRIQKIISTDRRTGKPGSS